MQVVTADNEILGTVKTIQLDVESWYLHTFSVKLDKEAHGKLGIKKLLFAKELTGLLAENIANVWPPTGWARPPVISSGMAFGPTLR